MSARPDCVLCRGVSGDAELHRAQVWEDDLWRLTTSLDAEVLGFSYLEPKRHIPHVTELDGAEAQSFGEVLKKVTHCLKEEAQAEVVYVYIFGGGIPHLHVHLAPHRAGDALNDQMIRGEVVAEQLDNGATRFISQEFPSLPQQQLHAFALRLQRRLAA